MKRWHDLTWQQMVSECETHGHVDLAILDYYGDDLYLRVSRTCLDGEGKLYTDASYRLKVERIQK